MDEYLRAMCRCEMHRWDERYMGGMHASEGCQHELATSALCVQVLQGVWHWHAWGGQARTSYPQLCMHGLHVYKE